MTTISELASQYAERAFPEDTTTSRWLREIARVAYEAGAYDEAAKRGEDNART